MLPKLQDLQNLDSENMEGWDFDITGNVPQNYQNSCNSPRSMYYYDYETPLRGRQIDYNDYDE